MFVINAVRNSGPKPEPVLKRLPESCLYLLMYTAQTGALTGKDEDTHSLRLCHIGLFLNKLSETNVGRNFWERKEKSEKQNQVPQDEDLRSDVWNLDQNVNKHLCL